MSAEENQKNTVRRVYNGSVNQYDRLRFGTYGGKLFDVWEKQYVLRFISGTKILHIGTATGRFAQLLPSLGYEYFGIEISERMAQAAKTRGNGGNCEVVLGDGEILPFKSGSFDCVLSVRSFHFLPDPMAFLTEARRVLREHGQVIASFEVFHPGRSIVEGLGIFPKPSPPRFNYRIEEVRFLFNRAGLNVLWSGRVTKLPLMAYFRANGLPSGLLKRIHPALPYHFGTVGLVAGEINRR